MAKNKQQDQPYLKILKAETINQTECIRTIVENEITFISGPAGCGKTYISVGLACQYLYNGKVNKIILTRPVLESGQKMGFLPGNLNEKIDPFLAPLKEAAVHFIGQEHYKKCLSDGRIEVIPLAYMRGRNFHNCFVLCDEAQNALMCELKMLITRIGQNTKMVINGDIKQSDLYDDEAGALEKCMKRLNTIDGVGINELHSQDIRRNPIISKILEKLN